MAAIRNGNTWYVDADNQILSVPNIKLLAINIHGGSSNGHITLLDTTSGTPIKFQYFILANVSEVIDFRYPILFTSGIKTTGITTSGITAVLTVKDERP